MPFTPAILERANQFLLLGVHRDDRLATLLKLHHRGVDQLKLGIAVGMSGAFFCLAIALQTVAIRIQHPPYRAGTDGVSNLLQFLGQVSGAFARPAQRRTGVATRYRLNQPLQGLLQACIGIATALAAPPGLRKRESIAASGLLFRAANSANPLRMVFGDM